MSYIDLIMLGYTAEIEALKIEAKSMDGHGYNEQSYMSISDRLMIIKDEVNKLAEERSKMISKAHGYESKESFNKRIEQTKNHAADAVAVASAMLFHVQNKPFNTISIDKLRVLQPPIGCSTFHFTKKDGTDDVCMYCGAKTKY